MSDTTLNLDYVELFAGAGGLSQGLEHGGWRCKAHAEIEPNARAILRKHWPEVRLDSDVTQINGADYKGALLLSGGSPCQDMSVAGKRAGLGGKRSGLFHEQVRIWHESDAPYMLWENVYGALTSNNGYDFAAVLSSLVGADLTDSDALKPDKSGKLKWKRAGTAVGPSGMASWRVLDLQHFGPPQRRVRVFVLAARAGGVDTGEVLAIEKSSCRHPSPREQAREILAAHSADRAGSGSSVATVAFKVTPSEAVPTQTPAVVSYAIDDETNAREELMGTLPARTQSGGIRTTVVSFAENQRAEVLTGDIVRQLTTGGGKPGQGYPAIVEMVEADPDTTTIGTQDGVITFTERGRGDERNVEHREDGVVNTIMTPNGGRGGFGATDAIVEHQTTLNGDVVPPLVARSSRGHAQSNSPGYNTDGQVVIAFESTGGSWGVNEGDTSPPIKIGSGMGIASPPAVVEVNVSPTTAEAEALIFGNSGMERWTQVETAITLAARDYKGGNTVALVGRPRRLTPLECERLMSWGDNHTKYGLDEAGKEYALSDTARYRLCGNGVGSKQVAWIARRLAEAIQHQASQG